MRQLLLACVMAIFALSGFALGQEEKAPPPPEPVPADVLEELDAKKDTDLGSSVDDLLANPPEVTPPEGQAVQTVPGRPRGSVGVDGGGPLSETQPDAAGPLEEVEDIAPLEVSYNQYAGATLRALDKITGRSTDIQVLTDSPVVFGSLNIEMKTCYQTPPELPPESAAFLSIKSTQSVQVETMEDAVDAAEVSTVSEDNPKLFSGWMFASSPGLSALEHPVYDVWVIRCNAA